MPAMPTMPAMPATNARSIRGLTMVELLVATTIMAILTVPIGLIMVSMTRAEQQNLDMADAAYHAEPLNRLFRRLMYTCGSDTTAGQAAFTITGTNDVTLFVLPDPDVPASRTQMARIWWDNATQQVNCQIFYPVNAAGPAFVVAKDIDLFEVRSGPTNAAAGATNYGGFLLNSSNKSLHIKYRISRKGQQFTYEVIAHASQAK